MQHRSAQHYLVELLAPQLSPVLPVIKAREITTRIIYITSAKHSSIKLGNLELSRAHPRSDSFKYDRDARATSARDTVFKCHAAVCCFEIRPISWSSSSIPPTRFPIDRFRCSLAWFVRSLEVRAHSEIESNEKAVWATGFVPTSELSRDSPPFTRFFMKHVISWAPFATTLTSGTRMILDSLGSEMQLIKVVDSRGIPRGYRHATDSETALVQP